MKEIYIFGNIDLPNDSLPLLILPELEEKFPDIVFHIKDPNEEWQTNSDLVIIDTVMGISDVTVFDSLDRFVESPRNSVHDFDAMANLKLLQKIGLIKSVKIIGLPPEIDEKEAIEKVSKII